MAMRSVIAALLAARLCVPAFAVQQQAGITAVQKVIQMLEDMRSTGKTEKEEETVRFTTYKVFCEKTKAEKEQAISKNKAAIEKLEADIAKAQEETLTIAKAIAGHNDDIAVWDAEKNEVTAQRAKEASDYQAVYDDYTMAMSEGSRVAATIKAGNTGESLLQLTTNINRLQARKTVAPEARRVLGAFLQETETQKLMDEAAPEAKTYQSQSFGALGIVEDMVENFEDKRAVLEKEEMKKAAAFDLVKADLMDSIKGAEEEREEKVSRTQEVQQELAMMQEDLARTKIELENDSQFLSDLNTECEQKCVDYEKRQVARAGEITAVGKAIEIMSGGAVSTGTGNLGLAQTAPAPSLAQLRTGTIAVSKVQKSVAENLQERSSKIHSKLLSLIAQRVGADPFKKVVKMIREMVEKLMSEGNEEAEHKAFCDVEMGTNQQTREQKTDEVEELTAQMEKATSDIERLTGQIADLSEDIAENDAAVAKASAERNDEKAKNTQTISESRAASAATLKAIDVLRDFYESQAEAAALAQVRSGVPGSPETFDEGASPIQGGSSGGVIGMLETIESDFKRLDAETTASEMQAAGDYEKFMTESHKDKAVKTADMTAKQNFKLEAESSLLNAKKDLKTTNVELTAALEYFEKLKPSCVEAGVSYEDRVAKRKDEIESLKEALQILNESAPAAA